MNPIFQVEVFGFVVIDTVVVSAAITVLVAIAAFVASRSLRLKDLSRWQVVLEMFTGWIRNTVGEIMEEDPAPYTALIGGLVGFIALCNLLAIVPVIRPPTADLSTAVALALVVMLAVPVFGIRRHGFRGYLRTYFRPHPLLLPLNLMGELSRTLALAVRLFGNIMSGQMIGAIALLIAGALVPVPLMMLGILTGLVQAYIFGILATVYIAAAIQVDERRSKESKS